MDDVAWVGDPPAQAPDDRAVLVHFWSSGCPLCHEGMRVIHRWRERYAPRGLQTIAVYQARPDARPEIEDAEREARALMRIDYPCAFDGAGRLAAAFENPYAPGYFFFDRDGRLRHRQMGNTGLARLDPLIARMLGGEGPTGREE